MIKYTEAYACLSTTRALLGVIPSSLRAVVVYMHETTVHLMFYYHKELSEEEREELEIAASEVECDFPMSYRIEYTFERVDAPAKIPGEKGRLVYLRKE